MMNRQDKRCGNCISIIHSDNPETVILNGDNVYLCSYCSEELHSLSRDESKERS